MCVIHLINKVRINNISFFTTHIPTRVVSLVIDVSSCINNNYSHNFGQKAILYTNLFKLI